MERCEFADERKSLQSGLRAAGLGACTITKLLRVKLQRRPEAAVLPVRQ